MTRRHSLEESGNRVRSPSPDDDVSVRIARHNVPALRERQTRHVFWLLAALEHPQPLVQGAAVVERPERNVIAAGRDDLIPIERMELDRDDCVDRALRKRETISLKLACKRLSRTTYSRFSNFVTLLAALPFPNGQNFVRRIVDGGQERSAVGFAEAERVYRAGEVAVADHRHRRQ